MDREALAENASDLLEELRDQTRETASLAVVDWDRLEGVVGASVIGLSSFNFKAEVGHRFPLHCTGPGKAFLFALPARKLRRTIALLSLKRYTRRTFTTPASLIADLRCSRRRGYACDLEEVVDGLDCIAAPVIREGVPVAAVWITVPTFRMAKREYAEFGSAVRHTADKIVRRMEGKDYDPNLHAKRVVVQAKAYLQEHLDEPVNMEVLAKRFHIGYCWFHRCFRRQVGISPNQYYLNLRLGKAARLLRCTKLSVKEIASRLGYPTPDYFSAAFKAKIRQSPQLYRNSNRAAVD